MGNGTSATLYTDCSATVQVRAYNEQCELYSAYDSELISIRYGLILGSSVVCTTGASYMVSNLPTGATISWDQGSSLSRTSAQGSNPCSFTAAGDGESWIEATIQTGCGDITMPRRTVGAGIPILLDYTTIPVWLCSGTPYTFIPEIPIGSTITRITGLSGGVEVPLTEISSGYYDVPGDVSRITLTMANNCGSRTESRLIMKANCLSFAIYPNPASNNVQLVIDGESQSSTTASASLLTTNKQNPVETYSIKIYNSFGMVFYSTNKTGKEFTILVNNLKDGTYIVEVNDGTQSESQQLIIKH